MHSSVALKGSGRRPWHQPPATNRRIEMANRTYGLTEVVGTASDGLDGAIRNGIQRAGKTIRHLDWFEVSDIRGYIKDGDVHHFQVTLKLGYRLEDPN